MKLSEAMQAVVDADRKVEAGMIREWIAAAVELEEMRIGNTKCCLRLISRIAIDWWRARRK